MGRLDGKVAFITGGARGLGEAIARRFVGEGARVVIADIRDDLGTAVAEDLGVAARYAHLDVTVPAEWASAVQVAAAEFGGLDVLVNDAGVLQITSIQDTTLEDYLRVITVNQVGAFLGMKTCIPLLKARGGGSIISISSVAGMVGTSGAAAYVSSKFAIRGLTKVAALELGQFGIRANSIHPGGLNTLMTTTLDLPDAGADPRDDVAGMPIARMGEPSEIANLALFLASDESSFSTGSEFVADGGQLAGILIPGIG